MEPLRRRFGFRLPDPSRTLALLYDRAVNAGRSESPLVARRREHVASHSTGEREAPVISAVTETAFAARRQPDWDRLDALSRLVGTRGIGALAPGQLVDLAPLYRDACADLARARAARYSAPLIDYLQTLTGAAHAIVYGGYARERRTGVGSSHVLSALEAFPRAVRARWKAIALASVLFFGPFIFGTLASLAHPDFALRIVPAGTLQALTEAYAKGFSEGRSIGASTGMAGFYVNNNVGIALRCFAHGIFLRRRLGVLPRRERAR